MTHSAMPESSGVTLTGKGEAYAVLHSLRPAGCPPGIDPREWREAIAARIEEHQDAIMALVEVLDGATPDADLEDGSDGEPWLGWPDGSPGRGAVACGVISDDREAVDEDGGDILDEPHDELDEGNDEPSLGGPTIYAGYGRYEVDLELDPCDKGEPDLDNEPRVPTVIHPNGSYIAGGGSGM